MAFQDFNPLLDPSLRTAALKVGFRTFLWRVRRGFPGFTAIKEHGQAGCGLVFTWTRGPGQSRKAS